MKEAGWMLQLLLLCAAFCAVIADCPPLDGAPFLHERVQWSYDAETDSCLASKAGSTEQTSFGRDEVRTLHTLGNRCLQFRCGERREGEVEVHLHFRTSGCTYRDTCGTGLIQSNGTCSLTYRCGLDYYNANKRVEDGGKRVTGELTVYTRYLCTPRIGSGPCPLDQCVNFKAPKNTSDVCVPVGTIIQSRHPRTGQLTEIQCQEHRPCNDDTTYVDWSFEIKDIPIRTTTAVPPSPETTTAPETEPPVTTVPTTEAPETEPPVTTVPTTEAPETEPPVITVPTTPEIPTVIFSTLDTTKCRPSKRTCKFSDNAMGCKYRRQCYPVNTQISWDDCTQFECHGDADRSQGSAFPRPTWLPRYSGCYGPSGCVTFGQKVRDGETDTVYNCTYTMGDLGFPVPEFQIVTEEED